MTQTGEVRNGGNAIHNLSTGCKGTLRGVPEHTPV